MSELCSVRKFFPFLKFKDHDILVKNEQAVNGNPQFYWMKKGPKRAFKVKCILIVKYFGRKTFSDGKKFKTGNISDKSSIQMEGR